jgi:hypothetical protein
MRAETNRARVLRYRKLALAETDKEKIFLLNRLADEAERGVLYTVDSLHSVSIAANSRVIRAAERRSAHYGVALFRNGSIVASLSQPRAGQQGDTE